MEPRVPAIRSTQTVLLALVMGILAFTGVVVFLRLTAEHELDSRVAEMLLLVAAGLGFAEIAVYTIVRRLFLVRLGGAKAEALELVRKGQIPVPLHTLAVIGAALAQGVGLLGLIALLLGAPWYALAAPALAILAILAQLPTRQRIETLLRELAR